MTKHLHKLHWHMAWMSYIGAVKGCLEYLGQETSLAWLYGGTGHAFVLCIHDIVCPSGPTSWGDGQIVTALGENIGYRLDRVSGMVGQPDFAAKPGLAWDKVRAGLDAGQPAFGWELNIPEFYVINGYDEIGYYYDGPEGGGPKPWQELGNSEIGWLEMAVMEMIPPADSAVAVKEALDFAVACSQTPNRWIHPGYHSGLDAYDQWMSALQGGTADSFGMAYNAQVWAEARENAVAFLEEARQRLGDGYHALFDEAIGHYTIVKGTLREVANLFPFHGLSPEHIEDPDRRAQACNYLAAARIAEKSGLAAIERLARAL